MRWWIVGFIRRLGHEGALENVRVELETARRSLEQAEAMARRVAPVREQDTALETLSDRRPDTLRRRSVA